MGLGMFEAHDKDRAKAFLDYYVYARDNDLFLDLRHHEPAGRPFQIGTRARQRRPDAEDCRRGFNQRNSPRCQNARHQLHHGERSVRCTSTATSTRRSRLCGLFRHADGNRGAQGPRLSRKSYEQHAVSDFDNPLSARYDENDALMFFDDVKVPWDRIFKHRDKGYVPAPVPRHTGSHLSELSRANPPDGQTEFPCRVSTRGLRNDRNR